MIGARATPSMRARNARRGFTLLELFVTVSVVATVTAVGIATVRSAGAQAAQGNVVQDAKDDLLAVRDQAVATIQCRRVQQLTGGTGNKSLKVFHDVGCTPGNTGDDVWLQTIDYDPAVVTSVRVIDNGIYDDEYIQYRTDGALFDTETTKVRVTTVDGVVHDLNIQLATGGVLIDD